MAVVIKLKIIDKMFTVPEWAAKEFGLKGIKRKIYG